MSDKQKMNLFMPMPNFFFSISCLVYSENKYTVNLPIRLNLSDTGIRTIW
jgi:hypothetical protein